MSTTTTSSSWLPFPLSKISFYYILWTALHTYKHTFVNSPYFEFKSQNGWSQIASHREWRNQPIKFILSNYDVLIDNWLSINIGCATYIYIGDLPSMRRLSPSSGQLDKYWLEWLLWFPDIQGTRGVLHFFFYSFFYEHFQKLGFVSVCGGNERVS